MKIQRFSCFRGGFFAISSLVLCIGNAVAAGPVSGVASSRGNPVTAEQISRAKEKMASAMSIADRFANQFAIGTNGALDPQRIQLINDLLSGDAQGLADASSATSLQQAMAAAHSAAVRKSNTIIAAGTHNAISPNSVGDTTDDLVYTPITPCRVVDTRLTATPSLVPLQVRTFSAAGGAAQGGGNCSGYPNTLAAIPAAMAFNVTADATGQGSPTQSGFLTIAPQGALAGGIDQATSWLNFVGGQIIANAGVASINPTNGEFDAVAQNSTYFVVDAFGYFAAPSGGAGGEPTGGAMAFTASMTASTVTTLLGGLVGTVATMPVSGATLTSSPTVSLVGGALDVTTANGLLPLLQTFPSTGQFTTLRATFMQTVALNLVGSTLTLKATLYTASSSNPTHLTATPLSCSVALSSVIAVGTVQTCSSSSGTASVNAGDTGLIVISGTATGLSLVNAAVLGGSVAIGP